MSLLRFPFIMARASLQHRSVSVCVRTCACMHAGSGEFKRIIIGHLTEDQGTWIIFTDHDANTHTAPTK